MENQKSWDPPIELNPLTIQELKALCMSLKVTREKKAEQEAQLKTTNGEIAGIEYKIAEHLKENGMKDFKGEWGNVYLIKQKSVTQPDGMDAKLLFFGYLQEQGIFNEMVNVNSRTLSSWAKKEIEAKEKEGVYGWVPPGLKPPTETYTLGFRK